MTELMNVHLEASGKVLDFCLTYDADFLADWNTRTVLERNQLEPEVVHLLARCLQPGDFAVDGGANIGVFSIMMAKLVGPTGKVLAFEPGPNNLHKLRSNLAQNLLSNVEVVTDPLWSKVAKVTLYLAHDSGNNALIQHSGVLSSVQLMATTLAQHCDRYVPKLIKLDVEGAERHALSGYERLIGQVPYVVCEMNDEALRAAGSSIYQLRNFMEKRAFHAFVLHPDGSLPTLIPFQTKLHSDKQNLNILFSSALNVARAWPEIVLK